MDIGNFGAAIGAGAEQLLAVVAGAAQSIHTIEASNPLVATATQLAVATAEKFGIPVPAIEALGDAVLSVARAVAHNAAAATPTTGSTG